jgi:hypothetical protein
MTLKATWNGDVVVNANSKKEAEELGEKLMDKTTPSWFEWGSQSVSKTKLFNPKTHKHEYSFGTGECICGEVCEEKKVYKIY